MSHLKSQVIQKRHAKYNNAYNPDESDQVS